jgi:hypothetical protein
LFAIVIIVVFAANKLDGFTHLFTWMSAVTAVAIMFVEILVSFAVVVYLGKDRTVSKLKSVVAPLVSAIGLGVGTYMLMSHFNLLGNLAPEGVDPTVPEGAWQLTGFGWFLVLLPFIAAVLGLLVSVLNGKNENKELLEDILS